MGALTDQINPPAGPPAPVTPPGDESAPVPAAAPPSSSLVSRVMGVQDDATRLGVATKAAQDITPDAAARTLALGDKTGLPLDMISRNLDAIEKASKASDFDPEQFRKNSPVVAQWMAESPQNAAIGHDDLQHLTMMEKLTNSIKGSFVGKTYESAMSDFELGNLGARMADGQTLSPDEQKRMEELYQGKHAAPTFGVSGVPWVARTILEPSIEIGKAWLDSRQMAMSAGLGVAGMTALAQPELAPVAAPAAGLAAYDFASSVGIAQKFSDVMRGNAYLDFMHIPTEGGGKIDPKIAALAANVYGYTAGAIIPLLTIPALVKEVPGGARALMFLSKDSIAQALTKQSVRTALSDAMQDVAGTGLELGFQGATMTAAKILATDFSKMMSPGSHEYGTSTGAAKEVLAGGGSMALLAGLRIPPNIAAMTANFEQARQAAENEATFKALGESVAGSKTFKTLPAKTQEMVQRMTAGGPVETVYAPMASWNSYWQGKGVEPREVARAVLGDTTAYDQAAAGGHDLPIPTAKYATSIAPTEHNAFFQSEVRTSPDGMNAREANEFSDMVSKVVAGGDKAKAEGAPAEEAGDKVVQNISGQLQAAGYDKPVADTYGKLWGSMFKTMGERTKQDAFELFQKYGLKIRREDLQAMGEPSGPGSDVRGIPGQPNEPDVHPPLVRSEIPVPDAVSSTPLELPAQHPGEAPESSIPFPAPKAPFDESITQHPDFVKLSNDADAMVRSYAKRRGVAPTPEFADALWHELHDALGDYKMAAKEKNAEKLSAINEKYPDLSNEWLTLNAKKTVDAEVQADETRTSKSGKGYFAKNVVGMTDMFRPKSALLAEQLAGSAQEPDMPLPTISEKDVMSRAQALLKHALQEREDKHTNLRRFIEEEGNKIGPFKKGLNGKVEENEEYATKVPIWARGGSNTIDQFEDDAKAAGVIPANARYGYTYEALHALENKGLPPTLEMFIPQARREAEHEAGYYQTGQGDLFPGTKSNVSETYDRLLKDATAKGMNPKEARAYAMKKMASGDTGAAPEGGVQRQFDAGGVKGFGAGEKGAQELFQGDEANRGRIRFGADRQFNIDLLKNADLSTFLHETGHFALEMMGDLAQHPDAPEDLKSDYAAVLKHLGVETRDQVGREQHEQFAKSFESYLMEGKAPSAGLRPAFAKFRAWMIAVYRKATNLGVTPSPEVKGVFDRLIASHDEIAAVESEAGVKPMFDDAKAAGMSEDQAARYAKAVDAAKTAAEDELSSKLIRQQQREQKKWWTDTKDEVTSKVAEDVHQRHEFIAQSILSTGKMPDGSDLPAGMEPFKLSKQDIIADYGKERLEMLGKPYVYTAVGGIHPDVAAERLGFGSGDELMTELARAGDMKKLIKDLTDEQMRVNFGDILKDGKLPEEAVKAVHNEKRSQLLQMELQHLASNDLPALKDVIRRVSRPAPPLEVTQDKAREIVAGQRVRDLTPLIYQQAEAREGRNATEAMLRGDFKEAFAAKQRELLNHELFRESTKAKDQTDAIVDYMAKFDKASVRDRIGKAGGEYLSQIDAIRDRYDFRRSQSLTAIDRRKSLASWAESQRALGYDVDIPAKLLDETQRQHYKDTTVEELSGVRDSVKTIEHLARVKNELLANERMRDLEQARDEVVASIQANHDVKFASPDENLAPGLRDKLMENVKQGVAAHTKMEFLFNYLDGEKPMGPAWRTFFKPMADGEVAENQMIKESSDALNEIFGAYTKAERLKWFMDKVHIPEIGGPMTKANILMVGMNMGNDHNRQAIMDGYHWSDAQLKAVTDRLDGRDWKLVQDTIDHIGTYWPKIEAMEKKLNGTAPQKVEATPIETKFGTFKGGYFPLIFDPKLDFRQQALNEEGSVKDMFGGGWARAMTKTGHTEARTNSGGHPPLLQFTALVQHLQNVIHDLAFRPAVIDVSRVANEPDVRANIVGAAGREMYNQIKPWIHSIAGDAKGQPANFMEGLITRVRSGVTTASIGLKLTSGLVQALDYGFTGKEIGPEYAVKGLAAAFKNPADMKQTYDFIAERSPMMKGLIENYERDVHDIMKGLHVVGLNPGVLGAVDAYTQPMEKSFFHFIGYMHLAVAMPSWMGGYQKAMDGKVDNVVAGDEADAVDYADSVVRKTKGSGSVKDLAAVQRGSPAWKLFTMFYTNLSTRFNQLASTANQFGIDRNVPKLVGAAAMIWFAPALMQDVLRGRTPSTDDDGKAWGKWMARKELLNPFESVIGVRDLAHGLENWMDKGRVDFQGSPAFEAGKSLVGAAAAGVKAVSGQDLTRSDARNVAMSAGYALKLPSAQLFQTLSYLYDWMKGNETPSNPMEGVWRAAIAGKKK